MQRNWDGSGCGYVMHTCVGGNEYRLQRGTNKSGRLLRVLIRSDVGREDGKQTRRIRYLLRTKWPDIALQGRQGNKNKVRIARSVEGTVIKRT